MGGSVEAVWCTCISPSRCTLPASLGAQNSAEAQHWSWRLHRVRVRVLGRDQRSASTGPSPEPNPKVNPSPNPNPKVLVAPQCAEGLDEWSDQEEVAEGELERDRGEPEDRVARTREGGHLLRVRARV